MAMPAFADLNKRQQVALLIGVPCALLIVLGYFTHKALNVLGPDPVLPPFLRHHASGNKWAEIEDTERQIGEKDAIIAQGPQLKADIKALEDDIKEAEARLPREAEKADMRQTVERLARDIPPDIGTVRLKSVKIVEGQKAAPGQRGADYQTVTYQTDLEGDLNGIIKYIDSLEKNARFMTVKSFTLKPGDMRLSEAKDKIVYGLHSVNMEVVTYVYTAKGKR